MKKKKEKQDPCQKQHPQVYGREVSLGEGPNQHSQPRPPPCQGQGRDQKK